MLRRTVPILLALLLAIASLTGPAAAEHGRTGDGAIVSFDHKTGNEWWVEAIVRSDTAGEEVVRVEATDDDARWHALTYRSWGAWAASFHVEPGHRVLFRATLEHGTVVYSCWFTHPEGLEQCEEGEERDQVRFDHEGGNEWWVEVDVQALPAPDEVHARDANGEWRPLTYRSWGVWAGSFRIEPGNHVQFRALAYGSMSDAYNVESCWYTHPEGVPQCDDGGGEDDDPPFVFDHKTGNEWWVEAIISPRPVAAQAMDAGGSWKTLTYRDWGAWAASFHVEPGHEVRFRAQDTGGAWHESCWFTHPEGVETCDEPAADVWPQEGSYAVYSFGYGSYYGGVSSDTSMDVTYRFTDGRWEARCVLETWVTRQTDEGEERMRTATLDVKVAMAPPTAPTDVQGSDEVEIGGPYGCRPDATVETVVGTTTHGTKKNGRPVTIDVWEAKANGTGSCGCGQSVARWHVETGLVVHWDEEDVNSHYDGALLDTDAPIAPGDDHEPRPREGWPFEGSFAEYETRSWYNGTSGSRTSITTRFVFADGAWRYDCAYASVSGDGATGSDEASGEARPPMGPLAIQPGDHLLVTGGGRLYYGDACASTRDVLVARGQYPERTTRDGQPHAATAWWADETAEADAEGADADAWFDVETGLLLRWESRSPDRASETIGWLVDTDAPLSSG